MELVDVRITEVNNMNRAYVITTFDGELSYVIGIYDDIDVASDAMMDYIEETNSPCTISDVAMNRSVLMVV